MRYWKKLVKATFIGILLIVLLSICIVVSVAVPLNEKIKIISLEILFLGIVFLS